MANIMGLPITTKHLTLRSLEQTDWPLFSRLHSDSEVMKHVGEPLDETAALAIFELHLLPWKPEKPGWLTLIIEHNDDDKPQEDANTDIASQESIGIIGLRTQNLDTGIVEMAFMLDISHSGKGYGSEAIRSMINYAFYNLNFHKISATCSVHNIASQKALIKNGFLKEGILRHNSMVDDHYIDDCIYGLLVHDMG
ncbi:MAG: ribosomal-protein-alanine N-acetyltransferase [Phenylobacterium sp.]|jgi:ribosomal-protein-alanine N-acetyltransferase